MSWSSACPLLARSGLRWLPSQNCQAACPYVTQERRRGPRLAHATSIAAPSQAPDGSSTGWSLPLDNAANANCRAPVHVRSKRPTAVAGVTELLTDNVVPLVIKASSSKDAIPRNIGHPVSSGLSHTASCKGVQTEPGTAVKAHARPPSTIQPGQAQGPQADQQSGSSLIGPCASGDPDGTIHVPCTGRTIEPDSTPSTSASSSTSSSNSKCTTTRKWRAAGEQFSRRGERLNSRRGISGSSDGSSSSGGTSGSETTSSNSKRNRTETSRSADKRNVKSGIGPGGNGTARSTEGNRGTSHNAPNCGCSSATEAQDALATAASGVGGDDGPQPRPTLMGARADPDALTPAKSDNPAPDVRSPSAHNPGAPGTLPPSAIPGTAKQSPVLTLNTIRNATKSLWPLSHALLRQRLAALTSLTNLDEQVCLRAVSVVPGLLLAEPPQLATAWSQLTRVLGGVEAARAAWQEVALLLVLPPERPARCVAELREVLGLWPQQAVEVLRSVPQLAVLAPATLTSKLEGLRRLLLCSVSNGESFAGTSVAAPNATDDGSGTGGIAGSDKGSSPSPASPPASSASTQLHPTLSSPQKQLHLLHSSRRLLASAVLRAPWLLTFATTTLEQHHASLVALLGPTRAAAALATDPAILTLRPAALTNKFRLLQTLLGCADHPKAVAVLLGRAPGILCRSPMALSQCCRVLSVWHLPPRAKLRMLVSRPLLLKLSWQEVHGRCRWLRRLVLSNAYYHAALRRLPPSVLGAVVAALPQAWGRLQYLADSCQEGALPLMAVVECEPAEFEARFPEYARWHAWKVKEMGCDNPWRGAARIRGFISPATAKDKPGQVPSHRNPSTQQQQHRRLVVMRQRGGMGALHSGPGAVSAASVAPTMSVVVTEAGQVRSGGVTVARPRRVVQRLMAAEPAPGTMVRGPGATVQTDGSPPLSPPTLQRLHLTPPTTRHPAALRPPSSLCCGQGFADVQEGDMAANTVVVPQYGAVEGAVASCTHATQPAEMTGHGVSHHVEIPQPRQQQQQQGTLGVQQQPLMAAAAAATEPTLGHGSVVSASQPSAALPSDKGRPTTAVWVAAGSPAASTDSDQQSTAAVG